MTRMVLAIDGPSGVGKSTLLPVLREELTSSGLQFEAVSNNDSSDLGATIRTLAGAGRPGLALCLTLAAARAVLLEEHNGNLLFDRYVLSSLAYQTFSGVHREFVYACNAPLLAGVVTIALEAPVETLRKRRTARPPRASDHFKRNLAIQEEVRLFAEGADLLRLRGHNVQTVNASGSPSEIASQIVSAVAAMERIDA